MKPRHYPLLTAIGGTLLTVAPLMMVYAFSGHADTAQVVSDSLQPESHAGAEAPFSAAKPDSSRRNDTVTADSEFQDADRELSAELMQADAAQQTAGLDQHSPELPAEILTGVSTLMPVIDSPDVSVVLSPAIDSGAEPTGPAPLTEQEAPEYPSRPDVTSTYYQATGHLAMLTEMLVPNPPVSSQNSEQHSESGTTDTDKSGTSDTNEAASGKSRRERNRKSKVSSQAGADQDRVPAAASPGSERGSAMPGSTTEMDQPALIEEVLVQTPVEKAPVGRVENVVAKTTARGWPVALVKSDLPDDVWWVQQMVGIQGDSFGARVNFGNEYSLEGSSYRMVVVFLDSPDEVRRFRIAKQFKQIPEGVRRSREFTYVRN